MKINQIKNNFNFRAGYTSQIAQMEKKIVPRETKFFFKNLNRKDLGDFYYIDFKDNKAVALGNRLCAEIFTKLRKIYDLRQNRSSQTLLFPKDIYVFNQYESDICNASGFQNSWVNAADIPNGLSTFYPGTVFIDNEINSLELFNNSAESLYKDNIWSSNHFLSHFIHEWLHAQFIKMVKSIALYRTYDYDKSMQAYLGQKLNEREKELVGNLIGTYAFSKETCQYAELYAESWTKFICAALSKDCQSFKRNPVELLRFMPKEFQVLLDKVSHIKMYSFFSDKNAKLF